MKPKIALINSSPRKLGESSKIVDYIIKKFNDESDFEVINLCDYRIGYCVACYGCKNGLCVQNDKLNDINKKIVSCNGIVMISPVYFGLLTAQLKTLIDRSLPLRRNNFMLKNKVGAAIAVGGSRNGGQELVIQQIHAAMHIHSMIIVGDDNHFGGTVHNLFEKDEFGTKTVDGTVNKMIETIRLIHKSDRQS